jgi:hypothetical protein
MEGGKSVPAIGFGKLFALVENHIERSRMCLHQNVGYDDLTGQVGAGALMTRILMISEIVPWPTVKAAFPNSRNIVRSEIIAESIAFVYRGPNLPNFRVNSGADGVTDYPCVNL